MMEKSPGQNQDAASKTGKLPFFSVIMAVYNRENLVSRAVDSLIKQKENDWELIIIDDGSSDGTYSRIRPYLDRYPQVTYSRHLRNMGWIAAKNTGIKTAKGQFITFLDSDDEYDPVHLRSRKLILIENPSVKFLYGGVKIIGNPYVPDRFDPSKKIKLTECVIGGTFFVEKSIINALNGFRELRIGEDADLLDRAREAGIPIMEVRKQTYIYHHESADSVTNRMIT